MLKGLQNILRRLIGANESLCTNFCEVARDPRRQRQVRMRTPKGNKKLFVTICTVLVGAMFPLACSSNTDEIRELQADLDQTQDALEALQTTTTTSTTTTTAAPEDLILAVPERERRIDSEVFWNAVALQREIDFPNETWDQNLWIRTLGSFFQFLEILDANAYLDDCQNKINYANDYGLDSYLADVIAPVLAGGEVGGGDSKGNAYEVAFLAAFDAWEVRITNSVRQLASQQLADYSLFRCAEVLG